MGNICACCREKEKEKAKEKDNYYENVDNLLKEIKELQQNFDIERFHDIYERLYKIGYPYIDSFLLDPKSVQSNKLKHLYKVIK